VEERYLGGVIYFVGMGGSAGLRGWRWRSQAKDAPHPGNLPLHVVVPSFDILSSSANPKVRRKGLCPVVRRVIELMWGLHRGTTAHPGFRPRCKGYHAGQEAAWPRSTQVLPLDVAACVVGWKVLGGAATDQ
jgi:hypothetical protein